MKSHAVSGESAHLHLRQVRSPPSEVPNCKGELLKHAILRSLGEQVGRLFQLKHLCSLRITFNVGTVIRLKQPMKNSVVEIQHSGHGDTGFSDGKENFNLLALATMDTRKPQRHGVAATEISTEAKIPKSLLHDDGSGMHLLVMW